MGIFSCKFSQNAIDDLASLDNNCTKEVTLKIKTLREGDPKTLGKPTNHKSLPEYYCVCKSCAFLYDVYNSEKIEIEAVLTKSNFYRIVFEDRI